MTKKAEGELVETDFAVVFPVEGTYLSGVPHVPTTTDVAMAERLVRTGAFRYEAPAIPEDGPAPEITVVELPEEARASLDFYDLPDPPAPAGQPEAPQDAGSPDSPEV